MEAQCNLSNAIRTGPGLASDAQILKIIILKISFLVSSDPSLHNVVAGQPILGTVFKIVLANTAFCPYNVKSHTLWGR